jgi:adenylate cyclase
VFDLLVYLVQNHDRVVTKDDLIASIWGGRIVSESTLTSRINAARKAIGDSGKEQRLIRTVPRKGIRFVGDVRVQPNHGETSPPSNLLLKQFQDQPPQAPPLPDRPAIAVLSFNNMSGDPEQEYFADGIVEDIITALSRFKSLFVIARNSSFAYKGRSPDIRRVGRDLGVRYVLEGSVRKSGNRLRITAQLIDAQSGAHIWADRFEGSPLDVFELQDEVTEKVVIAIAPRVEQAEVARALRRSSGNTDAYDCYLKGLACLSSATAEGADQALDLFSKANALDPGFATAYGMAMSCHALRLGYGSVKDLAREQSEVIRLWQMVARVGNDDGRALAHAGWAVAYVLRDLSSAKQLIDRAVELNPNFANAWINGGWINIWLGHPELAIEQLSRAHRLDPISITFGGMAHACYFLDRYEEALDQARHMLRRNPDNHTGLRIGAASAAFAGRVDEAHQLKHDAFRFAHSLNFENSWRIRRV